VILRVVAVRGTADRQGSVNDMTV